MQSELDLMDGFLMASKQRNTVNAQRSHPEMIWASGSELFNSPVPLK